MFRINLRNVRVNNAKFAVFYQMGSIHEFSYIENSITGSMLLVELIFAEFFTTPPPQKKNTNGKYVDRGRDTKNIVIVFQNFLYI